MDESQFRLEALQQRVEDGVLNAVQHESSDMMADQLSRVGHRWRGVKQKINLSLTATKSLVELQDQFELSYTRIRSILEGLERQFIDAYEIQGLESVQLVKVFVVR